MTLLHDVEPVEVYVSSCVEFPFPVSMACQLLQTVDARKSSLSTSWQLRHKLSVVHDFVFAIPVPKQTNFFIVVYASCACIAKRVNATALVARFVQWGT